MATSVDIRTYVLMSSSHDASVTLELVDLQLCHTWSMVEYETFLGKDIHTVYVRIGQFFDVAKC